MSIENKKISDEELENVSGGCSDGKQVNVTRNKSAYSEYNIPVDKYSGVIGNKYLFVHKDEPDYWIFGKLVKSYEAKNGAWTVRTHDIFVIDGDGYFVEEGGRYMIVSDYGTFEVDGDDYQMYAKA